MQSNFKRLETKKDRVVGDTLREDVLDIVVTSPTRITPVVLEKRLLEEFGLKKLQIKSVIRDLVTGGELTYTYEYGSTFLERSFAKPVRVSKHIVLQPPGHHFSFGPNDVVVKIKPGASFGAGNHPTTRLALQGIDFTLLGHQDLDKTKHTSVLDIGTGTGVLLIAAILCGMQTGLGVDIEACARVEADENVRINGLEGRAFVSGQSLTGIRQRFSLILANLRFPSLNKMLFQINEMADKNSFLILSGIRDIELTDLLQLYAEKQWVCRWSQTEAGWAGVVLQQAK